MVCQMGHQARKVGHLPPPTPLAGGYMQAKIPVLHASNALGFIPDVTPLQLFVSREALKVYPHL